MDEPIVTNTKHFQATVAGNLTADFPKGTEFVLISNSDGMIALKPTKLDNAFTEKAIVVLRPTEFSFVFRMTRTFYEEHFNDNEKTKNYPIQTQS